MFVEDIKIIIIYDDNEYEAKIKKDLLNRFKLSWSKQLKEVLEVRYNLLISRYKEDKLIAEFRKVSCEKYILKIK